jgi:hypothetical protein
MSMCGTDPAYLAGLLRSERQLLANPPFNDSDWFRRDDDVRWLHSNENAALSFVFYGKRRHNCTTFPVT